MTVKEIEEVLARTLGVGGLPQPVAFDPTRVRALADLCSQLRATSAELSRRQGEAHSAAMSAESRYLAGMGIELIEQTQSSLIKAVQQVLTDSPRPPPPRARPSRQPRVVVGLAATGHGASLSILDRESGLVRSGTLERFCREKHSLLFAAAEAEDLTHPKSQIDHRINVVLTHAYGRFPPYRTVEAVLGDWFSHLAQGTGLTPGDVEVVATSESHFAFCESRLGNRLTEWFPAARVRADLEHHAIHQAQAAWGSGWSDCAVLTEDTCGEALPRLFGRKICATLGSFDGGVVSVLSEFLFPHQSIGLVYATVTAHLGLRQGQEGKTMGLAPYGCEALWRRMQQFLTLKDDGSFDFIHPVALRELLRTWVPERKVGDKSAFDPRHFDVAFAAQRFTELTLTNAFRAARERTGQRRLAYAGGVALNSVANEAARRAADIELYVFPNAGDEGHSLGCAMLAAFGDAGWSRTSFPVPMSEYLGPAYGERDVHQAVASYGGLIVEHGASPLDVARMLAAGLVIARFAGSSEFGPRALGNRSILADPRPIGMRDYLNHVVKRREWYRPFAPAVLAEEVSEWFDLPPGATSPHMLRVVQVLPARRDRIPAVLHVDGSARVQTVGSENEDFRALLCGFQEVTGVPILVNTSFNLDGQPIVESPRDAMDCLVNSSLDGLFFADVSLLVLKRPPRGAV